METKTEISVLKNRFIKKVVAVDIGIFAIAGLVSSILKLNFWISLLFLGILVGGIGVYLGRPDPTDPNNPRNLAFRYRNRPNELLSDQISYNSDHLVPRYAFENVIVWAGLVAILISIPFVIQVMF